MTARAEIRTGDALAVLQTLPDASVQCCVTSPPYWGLRDYGVSGQLGLERTPDEYVSKLVQVFSEVRRVLRDDGTLWLNLGDSYAGSGRGGNPSDSPHTKQRTNRGTVALSDYPDLHDAAVEAGAIGRKWVAAPPGFKQKDLVGIPWRVAFALQSAGWWLRSEIIWSKPNPMPESVRDRPTKSHEQVFLLSKAATYYYDADAIAEPVTLSTVARIGQREWEKQEGSHRANGGTRPDRPMKAVVGRAGPDVYAGAAFENPQSAPRGPRSDFGASENRNARSVWTITTKPFASAHFATMPVELAQRCIKAASKAGDCILDPFGGAGTTGLAAVGLGRNAVLIELNPAYAEMARNRITSPLFEEAAS